MPILVLTALLMACFGVTGAQAVAYRLSFTGQSVFAYSYPSGAGVTYNAPVGDKATVSGSYVFDTADKAVTADGSGGQFYPGSTGSVTITGLVNLGSATYTFTAPHVIIDVGSTAVGHGVSVAVTPGPGGAQAAGSTDIVWVDPSHFEVRHAELNGGYELNEFAAVITAFGPVPAPEPESFSLLGVAVGVMVVRRIRPAA